MGTQVIPPWGTRGLTWRADIKPFSSVSMLNIYEIVKLYFTAGSRRRKHCGLQVKDFDQTSIKIEPLFTLG